MITKQDIARLAALHNDEGVLTAYVRVDPRLGYDQNQPSASFKSALTVARREADDRKNAVMEREKERVLEFLKDWTPHGKGLAIFTCKPASIWQVFELPVMVPSWVTVAPDPDTEYLAQALDDLPRLCVVMLDGGDGRIYVADQETESKAGKVHEELPSRHDQGGWSQARFQRHVEFHHRQVLKEIADIVEKTFYEQGFDRLVIVGVDEAASGFTSELAEPVRSRIIGNLRADFKQESDAQILERVGALADEDERSSELALVQEIIGFADAGGKGVVGIDETILALIGGRVDTLVVVAEATTPGARCQNCDYFAAKKFTICPVCGRDEAEEIPDAIEHAIEYALGHGSTGNIVLGAAAEALIPRGGIGALLRYPAPAEA